MFFEGISRVQRGELERTKEEELERTKEEKLERTKEEELERTKEEELEVNDAGCATLWQQLELAWKSVPLAGKPIASWIDGF